MPDVKMLSETELSEYLDQMDKQQAAHHKRMSLAHFNQLVGEPFEDMTVINDAIRTLLLDPGLSTIVHEWIERVSGERMKRRLVLTSRNILASRVANDPDLFRLTEPIQTKIIGFQPEVEGRKVSRSERNRILEQEQDRAKRRQAYYAGKELDDVIEFDVEQLIRERNRLAVNLGYSDYVELGLKNQDLDRMELLDLFEKIKNITDPEWKNVIQKGCQAMEVKRMAPWDLTYYLQTVMPSPSSRAFPKNRIIDVFKHVLSDAGGNLDELPIDVVIKDIPYGGLCIAVEFNKDIRILSNPRDGFQSYDVLFHEFGHGIQSAVLDASSYTVAEGDPPFFWEGIAGIYQHLMQCDSVLSKYFSLDKEAIQLIRDNSRLFRISWFRNIAVNCRLEWAAYQGETDLRGLMRELSRHYLDIDVPDDVGWAGNTLYTTHPLYSQNYLMMDVIALHTISAFRSQFGDFPTPDLFSFVNTNYAEPAGWIPWRNKIQKATGTPISSQALERYLCGDTNVNQ